MNLAETLLYLAQNELSNLSLAKEDGTGILESRIPKVVSSMNEALLRLHSRFVLREDSVLVEMQDGIATYEMKPQYAQSYEGNITVPVKYIMDLGPKKFKDDVIRITGAFDSLGHELDMNNKMSPSSLFTPRPKILQVSLPIPGEALSVKYQARHPRLVATELDRDIEIPEVLNGALTAYVGSMVFDFLGGQENMARAQGFMNKYEQICMEVGEKDGMGTETRVHSDAFSMKGWI